MVIRHHEKGPLMELDCPSSTIQGFQTASLHPARGVRERPYSGRSGGRDHIFTLPGTAFHGAQEELYEKESYSRPVDPKSFYSLSVLQDDNCEGRQAGHPSRSLYNIDRPEGCLLAYSSKASLQEVPGVQSGGQEVSLPCHALRAECGTPDLQETDEAYFEGVEAPKDQCHGLLRRLAGVGHLH